MKIDLHTHTHCSDGLLSLPELLLLASEAGLDALAITDHDTVAAHQQYREQLNQDSLTAAESAVRLISGIELSSQWRGMGVHVIGLNIDIDHPILQQAEQQQQQARLARLEYIVTQLQKRQLHIDLPELLARHSSSSLGRPHIAQYLVDSGQVNNVASVFRRYLGNGKLGDVQRFWPDIPTVVSWIKQSGGVAVLAHPQRYKMTHSKLNALLEHFEISGGEGLEVVSGPTPRSQVMSLIGLAKRHQLMASMGSDFHRPMAYHSAFGRLPSTAELQVLLGEVSGVWQHRTSIRSESTA